MVMGSLQAAWTHRVPRTPLQLFITDSRHLPVTSRTRATAKPCQQDEMPRAEAAPCGFREEVGGIS